jgi:DNA polymerase family A
MIPHTINNVIFLDLETYYGPGCSLTSSTVLEYIHNEKFHFICAHAISNNDGSHIATTDAQELKEWLFVHAENALIVTHNVQFDGAVLNHLGLVPHGVTWACTMSMMRVCGWARVGGASLSNLARLLQLAGHKVPAKGIEVHNMYGATKDAIIEQGDMPAYQEYCRVDTIICKAGFEAMLPLMHGDMPWQNMVHLANLSPRFDLDRSVLEAERERLVGIAKSVLDQAATALKVSPIEAGTLLRSNPKFAQVLESMGVSAPMKISEKTGKLTHALAKTDEGFIDLQNNGSDEVQALCAMRLAARSTMALSRCERFLKIHEMTGGPLPVPLNVSGAHTHRLSGGTGASTNLQNLPSGRVAGQSDNLRRSIVVRDGFSMLAADAKQIELRLTAYVADDERSMNEIRDGLDPYVATGALIYNRTYDEVIAMQKGTPEEQAEAQKIRQGGKSARLGLGFRAGVKGYSNYCNNVMKIPITDTEAERHVKVYRQMYSGVAQLWAQCDNAIRRMFYLRSASENAAPPDTDVVGWAFGGPTGDLINLGYTVIGGGRIPYVQLPTGMRLFYPALSPSTLQGARDGSYMYAQALKADGSPARGFVNFHGGILTENIIQALGAQYLSHVATKIRNNIGITPGMIVHDELVYAVPNSGLGAYTASIERAFITPPVWLTGLPLGVDIDLGLNYAFR